VFAEHIESPHDGAAVEFVEHHLRRGAELLKNAAIRTGKKEIATEAMVFDLAGKEVSPQRLRCPRNRDESGRGVEARCPTMTPAVERDLART